MISEGGEGRYSPSLLLLPELSSPLSPFSSKGSGGGGSGSGLGDSAKGDLAPNGVPAEDKELTESTLAAIGGGGG